MPGVTGQMILHYYSSIGNYYGSYAGGGGSFYNMFDWTLLLLIPAFIITGIAQARISGAYRKYSRIPDRNGVTGAQFAQRMLNSNNISGVGIRPVQGELSDHFDPRTNTVNLSPEVYSGHSVASVAIAAHECGHVLQAYTGYMPMQVRSSIVPVVNLCSNLSFPLILIGMFFSAFSFLVDVGAWIFFAVVIFQLVTLPVEFNASSRALANIQASGVLAPDELQGAKAMLKAAAMTYVAGMLSAFLSFLRLLLIANRRR